MEKHKKILKILGITASYILAVAVGGFVSLCLATGWVPFFGGIGPGIGQSKLEELENIILQQYIDGADPKVLEDAAAEAMVKATGDRWSYYIPADQYDEVMNNKNNTYVGIGITIMATQDGTGLEILKLEPEGPAKEAGILPGDILTAVEGQSVKDLGTTGAADLIQGEPGTFVNVEVLREGEPLSFTVERRQIQQQVATYEMLPDKVGYIKIVNFNTNCAKDTIAAVDALIEQGAESLVFDVRFNPGGYTSELVEVLDYLLPEGPLFRGVDYLGNETLDESDADCIDLPMAVLVNGDSYSAAEFFAAALQEYDWATVVGEQTVGKSNFQYTLRLKDGSAVALSTGHYFTPNGVNLTEAGGLTPDVVSEVDEETAAKIYSDLLEPEEDPQLQDALAALKSGK